MKTKVEATRCVQIEIYDADDRMPHKSVPVIRKLLEWQLANKVSPIHTSVTSGSYYLAHFAPEAADRVLQFLRESGIVIDI